MNKLIPVVMAVANAVAGSAAFADSCGSPQTSCGSITQADVRQFLYDRSGELIGSLWAVRGDQAVVWYGFVNTPGNHLEIVPTSAIITTGNRLVLNDGSAIRMATR